MDRNEEQLPPDLLEVAEQLRTRRHSAGSLKLDTLKRRVMAQATRTSRPRPGKGLGLRSRTLTSVLVVGTLAAGGGAGVLAAKGGNPPSSAGQGQYCNAGNGNGSEYPVTLGGTVECDPGNSPTNNQDNTRENPKPPKSTRRAR